MIEKSFSIVRTNPALTSNVKLVISSDYKMYLESFDANDTLRNERFKHFLIKYDEYWKEVLPIFYKNVENSTIFGIRNLNDIAETYTDYKFQFDDTYFSGAQFISDNFYNEEYEYTAPLYIKRDIIPTDFIILRVDGLGSVSEDSDSNNFRERILNQLKFVKRFDLTTNSTLGAWLKKNFVDDIGLPEHPFIVKHGDIALTEISGIDVKASGWHTKYINLFDIQSQNTPIFKTEEYVTKLWENNNLIYPDIINFKFLFDDTPATPTSLKNYSINRYLGFYIDEKVNVKTTSPFKGFELNIIPFVQIESLDIIEASKIPYIKDNTFIQEIDNRMYSYDPIKNGWKDNNTYWIEWKKKFYRLEKIKNNTSNIFDTNSIIGDYLYRIVADINIERTNEDLINIDELEQTFIDSLSLNDLKNAKKVLINDLGNDYTTGTTYEDRITITNNVEFNSITGYNIIENSNTVLIKFKRNYTKEIINGEEKMLFTLEIKEYDNKFKIDNFEEADLYLIEIESNFYVVKKYASNVPNLANKYYINTDWAIEVNNTNITKWINNGILTQDPKYYQNTKIETIPFDSPIPIFNIYRLNFTDIKDFDFDRIESNYTRYEYEKKYEVKGNIEPKFYAKDYRENPLNINTIKGERARRIPILDENNRPLNLRDRRGEINYFTGNPYTANELYYTDLDGSSWQLFQGYKDGSNWYKYNDSLLNLNRPFYREENYIWRLEDDSENVLGLLNFKNNTDNLKLYEELTWGINGKNEISDIKKPLPQIKSVDPNDEIDINYIPVSSEYISSDELWEIRNNNLTNIWDKNQSIVKWASLNSIGSHDQPYRLNYSLDFGIYNNQPNPKTNRNFVERNQQNLDYFYRFNLIDKQQYQYYTLHLNNDYFDIDTYLSSGYDYFESILKSDQLTSDDLDLTNKFSIFINNNEYSDSETIFRGVKYLVSDVKEVVFDSVELEKNGTLLIDDIITTANKKYKDYKFSIIFGKKKSTFSNEYVKGNGNSNMGVDIYLNDYWKNILIHLYINTDETIQLINPDNNQFINAETCEIDHWYNDMNDTRDINPTIWDNLEFKINNFGIGIRPRDFKLLDILNLLQNKNFDPKGELNKEKVNFIHVYNKLENNKPVVKVMSWENTDFIIQTELPKEFLIKENAFITNVVDNIPKFEINNTLDNRKIKSNNTTALFTTDGLQIDSVNDINTYNNYPIAKSISQNNIDRRESWELEDETEPSLFRYDSVYVPMFKNIALFRPLMYKELRDNNIKPILSKGNWKFYDPKSSAKTPILSGFGQIEELIFSKCNNISSILKIQSLSDKEKSIYPMVDEYGYDFDTRYIFSANFEPSYYYISKKIDVPTNQSPKLGGYTIHYDGVTEYLRIPDQEKFNQENYLVEDDNYQNYIQNEITGERRFYNLNINGLTLNNRTFIKNVEIVKGIDYKLLFNYIDGFIVTAPNESNVFTDYEFTLISKTGERKRLTIKDFANATVANPLTLHKNISTLIYIKYSDIIALNLNSNYSDFNTYNLEIKVSLSSNMTSLTFNNTLDMSFKLEMNSLQGINILDVNTDNYYLTKNTKNELGDILFGSFIKKYDENKDIVNYPAFSKISKSPKYTEAELDIYDTSIANVWREFAGLAAKKRSGRIGKVPYNYTKYPLPKNWNGNIYIDILNRLRAGSGTSLKDAIKNGKHFGYESYINIPVNPFTESARFDRATMYHFFEYGSQNPSPNTNPNDLSFQNSKFGEIIILNEFYKMSGFENFSNRGFNANFAFSDSVGTMRITNDTQFTFEPDRNTHILDGKKVVYIGEQFGTLSKPYVNLKWYSIFRDTRLDFNIVPKNGSVINISIPLIDPLTNIKYNQITVLELINNELSSTVYQTSIISNINNNIIFKIQSTLEGSYFNFDIILNTKKDFTVTNTIYSSNTQMISEKFSKTSLRDDRRSGKIRSVSIEFWIKIDAWERDWETILYKGEDTEKDVWVDESFNNFTWIIGKFGESDKLAFKTCHVNLLGGFTTHILTSDLEINDGNWHHVACVSDFETQTKQIWIDGELDKETTSYLEPLDDSGEIIDRTPDEVELLAQFMERRPLFVHGSQHPNIGTDSVMAIKFRNTASQDNKTVYWKEVIKGLRDANYSDLKWQYDNWSTTIDKAYAEFEKNYINLNYYLRVDSDTLNWDILIGTDSAVSNGRRNFEGFIDEFRIFNYARTDKEIQTNWRFILKREAYLNPLKSLVAYYRFDEGQGVNKINDLMNGYSVKDIDRWCRVKTTFINDGRKEREIDETSYYHFINSFYNASSIIIDDETTDWDESGADIIGISDERSIPKEPTPIIKESIREIEPPIFNRSKSTLIKRRMSRLIFNTKTSIFNYTITRSFAFKPVKWWLFKDIADRKNEEIQSSTIRYRIEREGKSWLNQIANLISKKRR